MYGMSKRRSEYFTFRRGSKTKWRFWLIDGCSAHLKVPSFVLEELHKHRIHIMVFPPNMTHVLQPLDLWYFSMFSLNMGYHKEQWLRSAEPTISKLNIGIILKRTFEDIMKGIMRTSTNVGRLSEIYNDQKSKKVCVHA